MASLRDGDGDCDCDSDSDDRPRRSKIDERGLAWTAADDDSDPQDIRDQLQLSNT